MKKLPVKWVKMFNKDNISRLVTWGLGRVQQLDNSTKGANVLWDGPLE